MIQESANTSRAKQLKRQYQHEWRQRNKAKVREYNERYWLRRAAEAEQSEREEATQHEIDQS